MSVIFCCCLIAKCRERIRDWVSDQSEESWCDGGG